ncbi:DUF6355 family natural product biosynthesis protein [Crossiella cryophila]|uniref:Secreted protein n=1 Tax=Crossiella cryophila TaxID=43355 RepID=A0A7W7FVL1_9PSEU|nr:DUF6355 family natural product biosynthesis protein [Crossiella cryophila]MBB4679402.1 hypothetical protein [Crossiella cryophila]
MRMSKLAAVASALALTTTGLLAGTASAAPVADPCGYFERGEDALYNHCPHDEWPVEVYIDDHNGGKRQTCVNTGTTKIGHSAVIRFAWSNRTACRV